MSEELRTGESDKKVHRRSSAPSARTSGTDLGPDITSSGVPGFYDERKGGVPGFLSGSASGGAE